MPRDRVFITDSVGEKTLAAGSMSASALQRRLAQNIVIQLISMAFDFENGYLQHVRFIDDVETDFERKALKTIDPPGFYVRHPPKPHELDSEITDDSDLFQTIHMGAAVVDEDQWLLRVEGLVEKPFMANLSQLKSMPKATVTAFHECYGSPVAPPIHALWRIGNVEWTGVRLADLLKLAQPHKNATHVWSQGLESGSFAGVTADRFEKDLTIEKAQSPEVILAYAINGKPLVKNRGGPVRLIVPGWFGTNSTKWLCRICIQAGRATGPFTTEFYNELDPNDPAGKTVRPVWAVEPNSMIVRPRPNEIIHGRQFEVWGRAWGCCEITCVDVSVDGGLSWQPQKNVWLRPRESFEWQLFKVDVGVETPGIYNIVCRARDGNGVQQPLTGRRNHVHRVDISVV